MPAPVPLTKRLNKFPWCTNTTTPAGTNGKACHEHNARSEEQKNASLKVHSIVRGVAANEEVNFARALLTTDCSYPLLLVAYSGPCCTQTIEMGFRSLVDTCAGSGRLPENP
ncbi:MAG: hypothetical protein CL912_27665 [Deltaproteobacteria bacterium]|nr:hypothetical protein [Deltaproteobacteria bacterium]